MRHTQVKWYEDEPHNGEPMMSCPEGEMNKIIRTLIHECGCPGQGSDRRPSEYTVYCYLLRYFELTVIL